MRLQSIQLRLMGFTVAAILLAACAPLYLAWQEHRALYSHSVFVNIDGLSANMANELVELLGTGANEFELTSYLLKLEVYEHIRFARIYGVDGKVLAQFVGPEADFKTLSSLYSEAAISDWPQGVVYYGSDVVALKLIGDASYPLGYLLLVNDFTDVLEQSSRSLMSSVLPFAVVVMVMLILVALFNHRRMLAPLLRLSDFAKQVELTGDYSLRVEATGRDEVAQLTTNICHMMEKIDAEVAENLSKTNQVLEQQLALEQLAKYDALTRLPNRQYFMEQLAVALDVARAEASDLAVMFVDLDGFKNVNDTLGHEVGDLLLIAVADNIRTFLREGDVLGRLSGDEFLVMLPHLSSDLDLTNIAGRIIHHFKKPLSVGDWRINVGASIGLAKASQTGFDLTTLISSADIAMYHSKAAGKGTFTLFDHNMLENSKRRLDIASAITDALRDDEFYIQYQPKYRHGTQVSGYEALARWQSPTLGFVSPAEFIPVAEQSGKVNEITRWVIDRVFSDVNALQRIAGSQVIVSLNLSPYDIGRLGFIAYVRLKFEHYNVSPANLEFEVTESVYLQNFEAANRFFGDIEALGARIALDDFGTGYSSLSYLTQLKMDVLKIDKSFVDMLGASKQAELITKTIIDMARHLNLEVCAEGVETPEQAKMLLDFGCDYLQGYLLGRPATLASLQEAGKASGVIAANRSASEH